MRRAQRSVHRVLWPILAVLVVVAVAMALVLRPPPMPEEGTAPESPPEGTPR
jgi:hypothetical protein